MPLKSKQQYVESLRDGRAVFWAGERIDDVTDHARFKTPIAVALRDYDYDDPAKRPILTYRTDEGASAHRV